MVSSRPYGERRNATEGVPYKAGRINPSPTAQRTGRLPCNAGESGSNPAKNLKGENKVAEEKANNAENKAAEEKANNEEKQKVRVLKGRNLVTVCLNDDDAAVAAVLTPKQRDFLKLFAKRQHGGAKDNFCTNRPIHIVQEKCYEYYRYHLDLDDGEMDVQFHYGNRWYKDEADIVRKTIESTRICDLLIPTYKELFGQDIDGFGEIKSYAEYFQYFGVPNVDVSFAISHWEDKAFFFIFRSAIEYKVSQAHNLKETRINTEYFGYGNDGEYEHFYDLLMEMGQALLEDDEGDKGNTPSVNCG